MINSRNIDDLRPEVAALCRKLIELCDKENIDLLVTSTYRDNASQEELYAQGRTRPGRVVTNARAGESFHNYRVAFDVVPLVNGKPQWNDMALWKRIGQIGKSIGLEWAGDWKRFKEMPHFQYTQGKTINDFKQGG